MMESKVFADNFSRSFSEPGDFFQFLSDRKARSKWMTAPSKELRFEPVERGSTLGNLYTMRSSAKRCWWCLKFCSLAGIRWHLAGSTPLCRRWFDLRARRRAWCIPAALSWPSTYCSPKDIPRLKEELIDYGKSAMLCRRHPAWKA